MAFALALHGGAGLGGGARLSPARDRACREIMNAALDAGAALLRDGATALDAVCATVRVLEDAPEFNAGRGAVLDADGAVSMDASVMCGRERDAGAVALLRTVRHPIDAARVVMEHTPHVLIVGDGAESLARSHGLPCEAPSWFIVPARQAQWEALAKRGGIALDHSRDPDEDVYGTVGAVARDAHGHVAAATSTGGMVNKHRGRIADTALIGAGTWADDRTCAVSCTGHGEYFIRAAAARRIADRMELGGASLGPADAGGVIAVDASGRIAMPFTTAGMFRAWIDVRGARGTAIWHDR